MSTALPPPAFMRADAWRAFVLASCLCLGLSACSPRQMVIGGVADELAHAGLAAEPDLALARDAAPFYLKLSESMLLRQPGHVGLATSVSAGFTQYAYAFVAFEADRVEAQDAQAATRLRQRAAALYARATRHALAALESRHPAFRTRLQDADPERWPTLRADEIGLAYWASAAWGSWIALAKDAPDVVADLPLAVRLAEWAAHRDANWGKGALASLRGTFEASRPGGDRRQAVQHFAQAIALADGCCAGPFVSRAEALALPAGDRAAFEADLRQALAVTVDPDSPDALQNAVMRRRAAWLLEQAPDLF